jgi:Ran GTPase-activating protein (RanGAP) involved in mRNA processing and transport
MEPDLPATLARCRYFTGLRQLALMRTSLAVDSVLAFFGESRFQTLRHLYLHGDNWPPVAFRSLANAGYTQLRRLQLPQCGMTDDGAESLANCAAFANLQTLELEGNVIEGRGVSALLASPHLRNLAYLGVGYNPAHHLDAALLAQAEPGRLRMFHAHGSRLRTADVRALARCPRMRTLLYLDLDNNRLHTAGVRELVRGFGKWCPPILWLTYNNIDNRGAEILANWKAANMLRVLHLKHNYIMDSHAARTLLDSPNLQNLDSFAISVTDDETQNRIAARFPREVDY